MVRSCRRPTYPAQSLPQADLTAQAATDQRRSASQGFSSNSLIPHDPHTREPGDQLPESKFRFDFMLSNPPFGVTWGGKDGYETEARKLKKTRYQAGMPRVNDGALLFLQTMLAKMKPAGQGASRIAIIFNGSPLSNGDCGSGESEIRRWILENDWLDAIVMLPDQLFYNTGIFTYIWLLRNDKPASHKGRVMLIDARQQYEKEPKSFGNKRNRITDAHRAWIEERYRDGWKQGLLRRAGEDLPAGGLRVPQGKRRLLAVRRARPARDDYRALREVLHRRQPEKGAGILRQRSDLSHPREGWRRERRSKHCC